MRAIRALASTMATAALLAAGCAAPARASLESLRARSAFDLACPPHLLRLYYIDDRTKGVAGCGKRLAYVESCDDAGPRGACTWVLDQSPPTTAASPAAGPGVGGSVLSTAPAPLGARVGFVCSVVPVSPPPAAPTAATPLPTTGTTDPLGAPASRRAPAPPSAPPAPPPPTRPPDPFADRH